MYIKKCLICSTEFDADATDDECPYCNWFNFIIDDDLDEDDPDTLNPITIRQAKENLAKGLDIWGKPLKK